MVYNFFTLDIEDWYHANYAGYDFSGHEGKESNLKSNIDKIIDLLSAYDVKSTCFVLASVAERKPNIVKKLYRAGHEIASHGYSHELVCRMGQKAFFEDLRRSCDILENIIGEKVLGYRAPSWSVKKDNLGWYYENLEKAGLKYSSSVYPAQNFLYGIPDFAENIHYPVIAGHKVGVLEIPLNVIKIMGKAIGFSGGFYLRFFPLWFIKQNIIKKNWANKPVCVFLHPREIDPKGERLNLPFSKKLIHYWGVNGAEKKIKGLLKVFSGTFCKISEFLPEVL